MRTRPPGGTVDGREEGQVLDLLAQMYSTEEIAAALYVSANTVKTHLKGIFGKLCVNRRVDAVRRGGSSGSASGFGQAVHHAVHPHAVVDARPRQPCSAPGTPQPRRPEGDPHLRLLGHDERAGSRYFRQAVPAHR